MQVMRAFWWLARARVSAGWQVQALTYLPGDPAVRLDAAQQYELVVALVAGGCGWEERWVALQLLRDASDDDLEYIFDPSRGLLPRLDQSIPVGHDLRPELESFLSWRFSGGRDAVEAGRVVPQGLPAGTF